MDKFNQTFSQKVIYVFAIPDKEHKDSLKVGESTVHNGETLEQSARKRIDSYTKTAGIKYSLKHTELALDNNGNAFRDYDVHKVLTNSGINKKKFNGNCNEWFETDLETIKNAIKAYKEGRQSLTGGEKTKGKTSVDFRPEQQDAIEKTIKQFESSDKMLWNAKMRFGKTLSALQVVKRLELKKTIIITHRPVVEDGWFEDFDKIFYETNSSYTRGSKNTTNLDDLEKHTNPYVYFASIQDLRGSSLVGGNFDKNDEIFEVEWDLVIIDEAHEGTKTKRGENVLEFLTSANTKVLKLSGTPFNLIQDFEEKAIYTWDYVMEQMAKQQWDIENHLDPNPYEGLPKLNIFTYELNELLRANYQDIDDKAFNFREFFKTEQGEFVHQNDVSQFLDLLARKDDTTNYPFSTDEYRDYFRHSLWIMPGVKEAKALCEKLRTHHIFKGFEIINVAGNEETAKPYEAVETAIGDNPNETYTITVSCGKLTTGVTVRAWTAILYLAGSANTSAMNYLQTIFRVQTPAKIGDKIKEQCYVFDFAPDRTLKVLAEATQLSHRAGQTGGDESKTREFLNFCPVISLSSSGMKPYSVDDMLQQLKRIYVDRVARNGFDDKKLYNDELLKLDNLDIEKFENLKKIIGSAKQTKKETSTDVNNQGLTDEEYEELQKAEETPKAKLTEEQKKLLEEEERKQNDQASKAISILRGISIRIPLMIYGADIPPEQDITVENFTDIIDDASWQEFMPTGVTKELYKEFDKYYDRDIFIAAGREIRNRLLSAQSLPITERVQAIAEIFSSFKNPDKETVLTPWRVVNMHIGDTLGGYNFFDKEYKELIEKPEMITPTTEIFQQTLANDKAIILEINSKTGLYPLYVAYSIYRKRLLNNNKKIEDKDMHEFCQNLWEQTLKENIYVVAKTKMAKSITERTLAGFSGAKTNIIAYENIIDDMKKDDDTAKNKILSGETWGRKEMGTMRIDAVVGNPPYQETITGRGDQPPTYHMFLDLSHKLSNVATLIHPARFLFNAGATPKDFNRRMLNDEHFKVVNFVQKSDEIFPNTDIKGGVCYTLRNQNETYGKIECFVIHNELDTILKKVKNTNFKSLNELYYSTDSYHFTDALHKDFPNAESKMSNGHKYDLKSSIFTRLAEIFSEEKNNTYNIGIIGLIKNKRYIKYTKKEYIAEHPNFNCYKVILPGSNGSGAIGEVLSTPLVGEPLVGHTQTFISFGAFDNKNEAKNLYKYIKTKFSRCLLGTLKITQSNKRETWSNVPLQDFTPNSDIDWTKSIAEIDKQLYAKYNLSDDEIAFIEEKVRPMDNGGVE